MSARLQVAVLVSFIVAGLMLFSASSEGQSLNVGVLTGLTVGTHFLQIAVSQDGTMTAKPIPIIQMPGGPTGPPAPPPPPPPDPEGLSGKVEIWTRDVDEPNMASDLVGTFRTLVRQIETRELLGEEISVATRALVSATLQTSGKRADWEEWRNKLTQVLVSMTRDGNLKTLDQYAAAYRDIEIGLLAAVNSQTKE